MFHMCPLPTSCKSSHQVTTRLVPRCGVVPIHQTGGDWLLGSTVKLITSDIRDRLGPHLTQETGVNTSGFWVELGSTMDASIGVPRRELSDKVRAVRRNQQIDPHVDANLGADIGRHRKNCIKVGRLSGSISTEILSLHRLHSSTGSIDLCAHSIRSGFSGRAEATVGVQALPRIVEFGETFAVASTVGGVDDGTDFTIEHMNLHFVGKRASGARDELFDDKLLGSENFQSTLHVLCAHLDTVQ
mmetsp:Transcript_15931/g.36617  ORF Transcript_15931/g.36617 Transcript_15931/m.36617 type:complete len:244 (+) Transcript_15931:260-991(+)